MAADCGTSDGRGGGHCPNCGAELCTAGPPAGHRPGCLLHALLTVVEDRGYEVRSECLADLDVDQLWDRVGGPAADWLEAQLDEAGPGTDSR